MIIWSIVATCACQKMWKQISLFREIQGNPVMNNFLITAIFEADVDYYHVPSYFPTCHFPVTLQSIIRIVEYCPADLGYECNLSDCIGCPCHLCMQLKSMCWLLYCTVLYCTVLYWILQYTIHHTVWCMMYDLHTHSTEVVSPQGMDTVRYRTAELTTSSESGITGIGNRHLANFWFEFFNFLCFWILSNTVF